MPKATVLSALVLLCIAASAAAAGGGTINKGGPKCQEPIVNCLVNPCDFTSCKPPEQWVCEANYCGGCKTDWRHKTTGLLLVNTCPPGVCALIFKPVCGVDGKTYGNACEATTFGIAVAYQGECKCPKTVNRVCGTDGVTYRNKCLALKNGTTVKYPGSCAFPTACAEENKTYKPVCGNDHTYANACVARLNGITDFTKGVCFGGVCARCILGGDFGCDAPHRCKGNPKYTCAISDCTREQVLDDGRRFSYGLCQPIYSNKVTGFPAAACLKP